MIKLYYTFSNPDSEAFIKKALGAYSGNYDFNIKRSENGKPYVESDIYFSLSHTEGLTVCAVSGRNIGADAEKLRNIKNKEKILSRYTGKDYKKVSDKEFFWKWTEFESRVKYFGEKISAFEKALTEETFVTTFMIGEYIVSVCSEEEEHIKKERFSDGNF